MYVGHMISNSKLELAKVLQSHLRSAALIVAAGNVCSDAGNGFLSNKSTIQEELQGNFTFVEQNTNVDMPPRLADE